MPNYIEPYPSSPSCQANWIPTTALIILSLLSTALFALSCFLINARRRDRREHLFRPSASSRLSLIPSERIPWPTSTNIQVGTLTDLDLEAGTTSFHRKSDSFTSTDALSGSDDLHVTPFIPNPPSTLTVPPMLHVKTDGPFVIRMSRWFSSTVAESTTKSPARTPTQKSTRSRKSKYQQRQSMSKTPPPIDLPLIGLSKDVTFNSCKSVSCSWDDASSSGKAKTSVGLSPKPAGKTQHKIPRRPPPPPYAPPSDD